MQNEKGREKERGGEKSGKYRERIEGDKERGLKKKKTVEKRVSPKKKFPQNHKNIHMPGLWYVHL